MAVAGIGGLVGIIGGTTAKTNEWTQSIDDLSQQTGLANEQASGFMVVAQETGVPIDAIAKGLVFMGKGLEDAKGGLGPTGKGFKDLGIEIYDANGNLKTSAQLFQEASDKINAMPDGITKTNASMAIFGKGGKEMGDVFEKTANGGLQLAIEKSDALGLTVGGKGVESTKAMNLQVADLKLTGQGLAMTFATEIIPKLTLMLGHFNTFIQDHGPQIKAVFAWLGDHAPLVLGILGVVAGVAFGIWAAGAIAAAIPTIALLIPFAPIIAIIAVVVAAIAGLYLLWTNNFGGIRDKVQIVADVISGAFHGAVKGISDFWNITFIPALQNVTKFFGDLGTAISGVVNGALAWLQEALSKVKGWLDGITLPWWLKPGSPTPFEMGLRGIGTALDDLSNTRLPDFNAKVNLNPGNMAFGANAANKFTNVTVEYRPMLSFADEREAKETLIPFIRDALRNMR
jgi:hypothetical protein